MKRNKRLWASESVPWACAFTKKGTLRKGITISCVGIISSEPVYHDGNYELNMNFSRLLVPFVDENIIWELAYIV